MINVIISGCGGQMGRVVSRIAKDDETINILCGFDHFGADDLPFPVYKKPSEFNGKADVIIDFSHPDCLEDLLSYALKNNIALVLATTGLSEEQIKKVNQASTKIAIFRSANMSLGINLIIDLLKKATSVLSENFDIEIIEKHHNQKIDAPSGTAFMLADAVKGELKETPEYVYDRHLVRKKRDKKEIGIHAVRGGTIVGEHTVIFSGNDEIIEITHKAMSKEIFAVGAVSAAKFMAGKGAGLYSMQDYMAN